MEVQAIDCHIYYLLLSYIKIIHFLHSLFKRDNPHNAKLSKKLKTEIYQPRKKSLVEQKIFVLFIKLSTLK